MRKKGRGQNEKCKRHKTNRGSRDAIGTAVWEGLAGRGPKVQGQCGDKRAKSSRRVVVEGAARSPEDGEGEGLFAGGQPPKEVPPVSLDATRCQLVPGPRGASTWQRALKIKLKINIYI